MDDRVQVFDTDGNSYDMLPVDAREAIATGHYFYDKPGEKAEVKEELKQEGSGDEGPTNDELRKILTERNVAFAANTSRAKLLQLVADSEPKE